MKAAAVMVGAMIVIGLLGSLSEDAGIDPTALIALVAIVYGASVAAATYLASFKAVRAKHRRGGKAGR